MRRVAIPIQNGKLSEYFGECQYYRIYKLEGGDIWEEEPEIPPVRSIDELPEWASGKGITDIITYKIDRKIIMLFHKHKINLFIGIGVDTPEALLHLLLDGHISSDQKIINEIIDS